jgi:DNA-binding NtrC family response regulator
MIFIEKDTIEASDLSVYQSQPTPTNQAGQQWTIPPQGLNLEDVERQFIMSALQRAGHNKSKAARLLGLTRDTLRYRLEKYQLL